MKKQLLLILLLFLQSLAVFMPIAIAPEDPDLVLVERDLMWNRYKTDDGTNYLEIGSVPLNYQDGEDWYPINGTFEMLDSGHVAYGYGYRAGNEKGIFNCYFKTNAQDDWCVAFAYNKSDDPTTHVLRSKLKGVGYLDPSQDNEYVILQNVLDSQGSIIENTITYPNVFTGTTANWSYESNKLKEEIFLSEDAKTMLQNNPPSDFGLSNQNSYFVLVTKLDYQNLYVYNGSDPEGGNFTTDGDIIFKDVLDAVKFAFPMGSIYEQYNEENNTALTYRLIQHNENYYLLSGLKIVDLNNMNFPVVIDPSVDVEVDNNDGYMYSGQWDGSSGTVIDDSLNIKIGLDANYFRGFLFFDTSGIGSNADITSACLSLIASDNNMGADSCNIIIQHNKSSYPTRPHNPLEESDWDKTFYEGSGGAIHSTDCTENVRKNITLNTSGLTWVNKIGDTKLILRSNLEVLVPDGEDIWFYSGDASTSYKPRFYVNYTQPTTEVTTNSSSGVGATNATVWGYLIENESLDTTVGFRYDTDSGTPYANNETVGVVVEGAEFSKNLTSLSAGTTYYYQAWASNTNNFSTGIELSFTTGGSSPTVTTNASTLIEETSATLNGYLSSNGSIDTTVGFRYDVNSGTPYDNNITNSDNLAPGTTFSNSTTLSQGTKYYFQAWASNAIGFATGSELNLLTKPEDATSLIITSTITGLSLSWTHGTGYNKSVLVNKTGSLPTSPTDGTVLYNGSEDVYDHASLVSEITYYYAIWEYTEWTNDGTPMHKFSDNELTGSKLFTTPPNLVVNATTGIEEENATLRGFLETGSGNYNYGFWLNFSTPVTEGTKDENVSGAGTISAPEESSVNQSLTEATTYFVKSWVSNATYFNSSENEDIFYTKGFGPTDLALTTMDTTIRLTWTKVTNNGSTVITRKAGSAPSSMDDGTKIFNSSSGSLYDDTGAKGNFYFYRVATWYGDKYSDGFEEESIEFPPDPPTDVTGEISGSGNLVINWTKGSGTVNTVVIRKEDSYPTSETDGTEVYNNTGSTHTESSVSLPYYYTLFSYANGTFSTGVDLAYGGIVINCYDEETNLSVNPYDVFITNQSGSETFQIKEVSNPHLIDISQSPTGSQITIKINANEIHNNKTEYFTDFDTEYITDIFTGYGPEQNGSTTVVTLSEMPINPSFVVVTTINATNGSSENPSFGISGNVVTIAPDAAEIFTQVNVRYKVEYSGTLQVILNQTARDKESTNVTLYNNSDGTETYPPFTLAEDIVTMLDVDLGNFNQVNVTYKHDEYEERYYHLDLAKNQVFSLDAYLPRADNSNLYRFIVEDTFLTPIEDAFISVKRIVNDRYENVSTLYTDTNGQVDLYLLAGKDYKVIISKEYMVTEIADISADPIFYGILYPVIFKLDYDEAVIPTETFDDIIIYRAEWVNTSSSIKITFTDKNSETIDVNFRIYESYNFSLTLISSKTFTGYNTLVTYIEGANNSRLHEIRLEMNHTTLGYVANRTIYLFPSNHSVDVDWVENQIRSVFGNFDMGYVNLFILYFPAIIVLVTLGFMGQPGLATFGTGLWLGFCSMYMNFSNESTIIGVSSILIVLGIVTIAVKKGRHLTK